MSGGRSAGSSGELLSRREAAKRAGVHINTIVAWEKKGLLPTAQIKTGGATVVRIHRADLEAVVAAGHGRDQGDIPPPSDRRGVRERAPATPEGRRRRPLFGSRRTSAGGDKTSSPHARREARREAEQQRMAAIELGREEAGRAFARRERQLVREVERRTEQLEQETLAAQEIRERLNEEHEVLARARHDLNEQIRSAREQVAAERAALDAEREGLRRQDRDVERLQSLVDEATKRATAAEAKRDYEIMRAQAASAAVEHRVEEAEALRDEAIARVEALTAELRRTQQATEALEARAYEAEQRAEAAARRHDSSADAAERLRQAEEGAARAEAAAREAEAATAQARAERDEALSRAEAAAAERDDARTRADALAAEAERVGALSQEAARQRELRADAEERLREAEERASQAEARLQQAEAAITQAEADKRLRSDTAAETERIMSEAAGREQALLEEVERLQDALEKTLRMQGRLEQATREQREQMEYLRHALREAQRGGFVADEAGTVAAEPDSAEYELPLEEITAEHAPPQERTPSPEGTKEEEGRGLKRIRDRVARLLIDEQDI